MTTKLVLDQEADENRSLTDLWYSSSNEQDEQSAKRRKAELTANLLSRTMDSLYQTLSQTVSNSRTYISTYTVEGMPADTRTLGQSAHTKNSMFKPAPQNSGIQLQSEQRQSFKPK